MVPKSRTTTPASGLSAADPGAADVFEGEDASPRRLKVRVPLVFVGPSPNAGACPDCQVNCVARAGVPTAGVDPSRLKSEMTNPRVSSWVEFTRSEARADQPKGSPSCWARW